MWNSRYKVQVRINPPMLWWQGRRASANCRDTLPVAPKALMTICVWEKFSVGVGRYGKGDVAFGLRGTWKRGFAFDIWRWYFSTRWVGPWATARPSRSPDWYEFQDAG